MGHGGTLDSAASGVLGKAGPVTMVPWLDCDGAAVKGQFHPKT